MNFIENIANINNMFDKIKQIYNHVQILLIIILANNIIYKILRLNCAKMCAWLLEKDIQMRSKMQLHTFATWSVLKFITVVKCNVLTSSVYNIDTARSRTGCRCNDDFQTRRNIMSKTFDQIHCTAPYKIFFLELIKSRKIVYLFCGKLNENNQCKINRQNHSSYHQ